MENTNTAPFLYVIEIFGNRGRLASFVSGKLYDCRWIRKETMTGYKRLVVAGLLIVLVSMTACGTGTQWIFSLNGEKVTRTDVNAYGFVYAMDHNITNEGQMDEMYEDGETYAEHYKDELEREIVSVVLLAQEAEKENFALPKEETAECEEKAALLIKRYGKEYLENQKITQQDICKIYERKQLGDRYVEDVSEQETDASQQEESEEIEQYVEVYQVLFPTVELDEAGMLVTNADGTMSRVTMTQQEQQKKRAEELVQKVQEGSSLEKSISAYGQNVIAGEKTLKYQDLDTVYKKMIDLLSVGSVSDVFQGTYGYYVIRLKDKNEEDYKQAVSNYEKQMQIENEKQEILDRLYDLYVGSDKEYRNDQRWEDTVIITDYLQ